jgi:ABC-type transporter Mla MlaB component
MATATTSFAIYGPILRSDLPGLTDRVCGLLRETRPTVVFCDVHGVQADAVTVDALARLQLAAHRTCCRIWLQNASPELRRLVDLMGLADVLPETTEGAEWTTSSSS